MMVPHWQLTIAFVWSEPLYSVSETDRSQFPTKIMLSPSKPPDSFPRRLIITDSLIDFKTTQYRYKEN